MTEWIVTSSALIAAVIALRFLFHGKISRRMQYALWGLVLLRLLMPFSLFGSPVSIMNAVDPSPLTDSLSGIQVYSDVIRNTGMTPDEARAAGNGTLHEIQGYPAESGNGDLRNYIFTDSLDRVLGRILRMVWLGGGITAGLWVAGTNLLFYRRVRKDRAVLSVPDCALPVYVTAHIASPCLFGIPRPSVYLTPKAAEDADGIRLVLAHELCHCRHGDHIWSMLRGLCLALWWWNPLVWAAAILSRTDGELACDEAVVKGIGEENRLVYGRTLVDMIAVREAPSGLMCAATTMVSGKRGMQARLNMIVSNPKALIPAMAAVLLIAAVCVGCTFTGAQRGDDQLKGNENVSAYAQQLYDRRVPYIGAAPDDTALLEAMGVSGELGGYTLELETENEPYVLRLVFNDKITDAEALNTAMRADAVLLLALIDNAAEIQWRYTYTDPAAEEEGVFTGSLSIADANAILNDADIKDYGQSAAQVQALLDRLSAEGATEPEFPAVDTAFSSGNTDLAQVGRDAADFYYGQLTADDVPQYWHITKYETLSCELTAGDESEFAVWVTSYIETDGGGFLLGQGIPTDSDDISKGGVCPEVGRQFRIKPLGGGQYEIVSVGTGGGDGGLAPAETPGGGTEGPAGVSESVDRTDLSACVSDAILAANSGWFPGGDLATEAHTVLATVETGDKTTVYAMALYLEFNYAGGGFTESGGSHMPVAVTFEKNDTGEYAVKEYWEPQDGRGYASSIEAKFPSDVYAEAIDTQQYITKHMQSCYAQAVEYGNVDTDAMIAGLLEIITSSPRQVSNPQAYIDAHEMEYRQLIYLGEHTLRYYSALYEQGEYATLEGSILALACRDMLGDDGDIGNGTGDGEAIDWEDIYDSTIQWTWEREFGNGTGDGEAIDWEDIYDSTIQWTWERE